MSSFRLPCSRSATPLAILVAILVVACGVPDYKLSANTDAGSSSIGGNIASGGNSVGGGTAELGGNSGTGGRTAVIGCSSNSDCSTYSATRVCDSSVSPGRCVECLPGRNDCETGLYCGSDKQCHVGCSSNADCGNADCDASVCPALTCDASTHLCVGCARDSDCLAGTKCNKITDTCVPSCSESVTCPADWVCCAGSCVNLESDATNCASCGTTCAQANANVQCLNGTCRIEGCVEGYADCNSAFGDGCETDLLSDATNCKTCGNACASTLMCRNGVCTTPSCTTTYLDCDNVVTNGCETDTQRDVLNCGSCGNKCSTVNGTPSCVSGSCVMTCSSGWGDCNGNANDGCETDLTNNTDHCGTCKVGCANNHGTTSCVASKCVPKCLSGFDDCNADPIDGCEAALTTDASNCGTCGSICTLAHGSSTCTGGKCAVAACEANYGDCNGIADDGCETPLLTLAANCGKCGNVCSSVNGTGACSGGQCTISCSANYRNCDNDVSNGCEADLTKSVKNCGACGTICADTADYAATCTGGVCGVSSCIKPAAECDNNAATPCEANLNTDVSNCGSCGHVCSFTNATASCSNGVCVLAGCNAGYADCDGYSSNGCEVNVTSDPANCGKCASACPVNHSTVSCTNSVCAVTSCEAGYVDCNGVASDGCESHPSDDAHNCGACNVVCSLNNAIAGCANNTCVISSCNNGYADCNTTAADGCEVALATDPTNCGVCKTVCNTNNGTATCAGGGCGIVCNPNFGDCDADVTANGCETDLASTTLHCGSCNTACTNGYGTTSCVSGVCSPVCGTGYLSCDDNLVNGCEQSIYTDTSHCGSCTTVCGSYTHASTKCETGACGMGPCDSDYGDCNSSATDGCETLVTNDPSHCGSCATVCPSANGTASCTDKVCSIACNTGYGDCVAGSDGCETNILTSTAYCGSCTNSCSGSSYPICNSGKCMLDIVAQTSNAVKGTGIGTNMPTISHTLSRASSSNRLVIVTVVGRGDTNVNAVPVPKYKGISMQQYGDVVVPSSPSSGAVAIYYLKDADLPATAGGYDVTFGTTYTQNYAMVATVVEFDNVDQTTPFVALTTKIASSPSSTTVSVNVPVQGDYSLEVLGANAGSTPTVNAASGQTIVGAAYTANAYGVTAILGPFSGTASQSLNWTMSSCNTIGEIAVVLGRASG